MSGNVATAAYFSAKDQGASEDEAQFSAAGTIIDGMIWPNPESEGVGANVARQTYKSIFKKGLVQSHEQNKKKGDSSCGGPNGPVHCGKKP